jgi:dipeptidase
MCDALAAVGSGRLLFAKNSDRPPSEAQVVRSLPRRPASSRALITQYLDLGPDPGACAVLLSQPTWLWGAEHGVNEHGVAVGNEKVWTIDDPRGAAPALLGMDIVRLALERARSAEHAVAIITELVETHGQGGSGERDHDEPYHSAFLVADAAEAWIVETSNRTWAARRTVAGGVAISNRLSLDRDWDAASVDVESGRSFQDWRLPNVPTTIADHRLAATTACVRSTPPDELSARAVVATLRDHGAGPWGAPSAVEREAAPSAVPDGAGDDHRGISVCMHLRGYQSTTASMVVEVADDATAPVRTWTALGSPCASVYVPGFGLRVAAPLDDQREWSRFAALRDRVEDDGDALAVVRATLAPAEAELWDAADTVHARDGDRIAFVASAYGTVDEALTRLGV